MNNFWLKKLGWFAGIFVFMLLFNLNKSRIYESETDILLLPKNETGALSLDATIDNFKLVLESLAFNDRIAENSDALEAGLELPNYKRKEFWNSKLSVARAEKSGVIRIKNFDKESVLARELNADTVENLIAVAGNYYDIKTDLEMRIIDGPIVQKIAAQNLPITVGVSALWSLGIFVVMFFLFPFIFIKKEPRKRALPGQEFSRQRAQGKKIIPAIIPEEENYFATRDFFEQAKKTEEVKVTEKVSVTEKVQSQKSNFSLPTFPSFGKKAPTPVNLPVNEEEIPDIFRQKATMPEVGKELVPEKKEEESIPEYIPREATPVEVRARLNRLLSGGK